jgi:hypothetical protein
MEEDHTEVNKDVRDTNRVTITDAATLLGVHPNTLRRRVRVGSYDAKKVATENSSTCLRYRNSLVNNPLPRDSQPAPSQKVNLEHSTPTEAIRDLLRPFVEDLSRVREELGAERVRREHAERERDELRIRLEALQESPQTPETPTEEPEKRYPGPGRRLSGGLRAPVLVA